MDKIPARYILLLTFLFSVGWLKTPVDLHAQKKPELVKEYSWRFDNFETSGEFRWSEDLSWDLYRDTFIGIPPRDATTSIFHESFYNGIYKRRLTEVGNCFGMVLLSHLIKKKGHHGGLCAPVRQYDGVNEKKYHEGYHYTLGPESSEVKRAINRMHGHQVNLPTLRHLMNVIQQRKNRDGNYAFEQAKHYIEKEGATPISITESLDPSDGGHAMLAYATEETDATKKIYVYDPSRPWDENKSYYRRGDNVIEISSDNGEWEFTKSDGGMWSGKPDDGGAGAATYSLGDVLGASDDNGGNIMVIPTSVTAPTARAPGSLGLNTSELVHTIAIFGEGASISQASSPDGGLDNVIPWYPSDALPDGKRYDFQMFTGIGEPKEIIDFQVQNNGPDGYTLDLAGGNGRVKVESMAATETDALSIENLGSVRPGLTLQSGAGASYRMAFHRQYTGPEPEKRVFILPRLNAPTNAKVEMTMGKDGPGTFSIQSLEVSLPYELKIRRVTPDGAESITLSRELPPGSRHVIEVTQWDDLSRQNVRVREIKAVEEPE